MSGTLSDGGNKTMPSLRGARVRVNLIFGALILSCSSYSIREGT